MMRVVIVERCIFVFRVLGFDYDSYANVDALDDPSK